VVALVYRWFDRAGSTPPASIGRMAGAVRSKWLWIVPIAIGASVNGYEDITSVPSFQNDWIKFGTAEADRPTSMLGNTGVAMSLRAASGGSSNPPFMGRR